MVDAYYNKLGVLKAAPNLNLDETFLEAKKALDNYNENQLIYDEFNYYQDTKKVLGVHPVFRVYKLKFHIEKMREATAVKRASNLDNYIRRDTNKLKNITDTEKKNTFLERIMLWKEELELIKKMKNLE